MKKVKGIVISILIAIFGISTMPFSVVHADEYEDVNVSTSNILGISVFSQENVTTTFLVTMDNYYVGTMTLRVTCYLSDGSSQYKDIAFSFNGTYGYGSGTYNSRVESITSFRNIRSQSLKVAVNSDQYYFPYESLNFIVETAGRGYEQTALYNLGKWTIPVFSVPANGEITHKYLYSSGDNSTMTIVLWVNKQASSITSFLNYFSITNGSLEELVPLNVFAYNGTNGTRLVKVVIRNNTTSTNNVYLYAQYDMLIMPIYAHSSREMGFETKDFCDNFGLPYNGLDSQSQESVNNLEDTMSDFTQASDDVINVENDIGSGFENSLDDIPTSFNYSNQFGASFISSAQWVRNQFNSMTINNPFGSLITFSLILGVGLLLLGRKLL